MKPRVLLDTGLLLAHLYADKDVILDADKLALRQKGRRLIEDLIASGAELLLTYQNLREAYATATRSKQAREGLNLPPRRAAQDLELIYESDLFIIVAEDEAVLQKWLDILYEYQITGNKAFDAYLAAFAQVHRVDYVLTYDAEIFERVGVPVQKVS